MRFAGDRTGTFNGDDGTGLVGKIVGPSVHGLWFRIESATFDEEANRTKCHLVAITAPHERFAQMLIEQSEQEGQA